MLGIPEKVGFYKRAGAISNRFEECPYADSKQIDENNYWLQHDLFYRARDGKIYVIKKGFIHDGASKGFLKHFGKYTNASILHDGLYAIQYDRSESDELFDEAMEESDVPGWKNNSYWFIVRLFGWWAFKDQAKEDVEKNKKFVEILGAS